MTQVGTARRQLGERGEPQGRRFEPQGRRVEPQGREARPHRAVEAVSSPAVPGRPGADGASKMSPRARSRAARDESEGYPRQRAVSCIHSLTYHPRLQSPAPTLVIGLYRMQHRQSPPRAAAWNMESFLYRQPERRAAFRECIPLGERKTPDCSEHLIQTDKFRIVQMYLDN